MTSTRAGVLVVSALLFCALEAAGQQPSSPAGLQSEDEKTIYAIGLLMGRQLGPLGLSPAEIVLVTRGLNDAAAGKPLVDLETYVPKIQQLAQARAKVAAESEKSRSQAFLEATAKEEGSVRSPSGLLYRSLKPGSGPSPKATDTVQVHYVGKLTGGAEFDSSRKRGQPAEFALNQVIPCWTEGVQKMKVGETAQLICPSSIAYGDQGHQPTIPGGATLVFEIELISIKP